MVETDFLQPDEQRDFALLVEGQKVYICCDYLAHWSAVLRNIFYPEGASFEQPKGGMLMKEKKLDEFLIFLHAIFPTEKAMIVNESNAAVLLVYADEYDVGVLRDRCVKFMGDALKREVVADESLIDWLRLSALYSLKDLQNQLVPLVAQIPFDIIEAAQSTLPLGVVAAVFYSKSWQMADAGASLPVLPKGAFSCIACGSETCSIIKGTSSCCSKGVGILPTAVAELNRHYSFTCTKCSKPCSTAAFFLGDHLHSSCCRMYGMFVYPKCELGNRQSGAAAAVGSADKAARFSTELLDRQH